MTVPPARTRRELRQRERAGSSTVGRASAVMAAGSLASRVLGLVRASLLVAVLGGTSANPAANAFGIANNLPNLIFLLVAGGTLNAVLVPQIVRADTEGERGRVRLDRLLTIGFAGLAVVTVAVSLAAPLLVGVSVRDYSPDQRALAVAFAFWCLPQVFFYGVYALVGQVLNARGSFGPFMWAPAANNVVAVAGLAAVMAVSGSLATRSAADFGPGLVAAIAGTATLGVVVQALVLIPALRGVGFRWRPRWGWRGAGLRSAGTVAAWTFGALVASQLAVLVLMNVATANEAAALAQGSAGRTASQAAWVSALLVFTLPHGLIAVSVVTAQFTGFARAVEAGDLESVRRDTRVAVRLLLAGMALPAAALVALSQPVAELLFGGGYDQGLAIGAVLAGMAVGLPVFSASYQLQRVFYALRDGRTPFVTGLVGNVIWVAGMLAVAALAPPPYVVPGAAVVQSFAQVVTFALLLLAVRRRLGDPGLRGIAGVTVRSSVAALVAVGVTVAVLRLAGVPGTALLVPAVDSRAHAVLPVVGGGVVIVAAYLGAGRLLRLGEVGRIMTLVAVPLRARLRPRRR